MGAPVVDAFKVLSESIKDSKKKKKLTKEEEKERLKKEIGYENIAMGLLIFLAVKCIAYFLGGAYTRGIFSLVALIILFPLLIWERRKLKRKLSKL